jgi:hypothetical protein
MCDDCPDDPGNDADHDGYCAGGEDNCEFDSNPDQADSDGDRIGNACDACPDESGYVTDGGCPPDFCEDNPACEPTDEDCDNLIDDDWDRAVDCADDDCEDNPDCEAADEDCDNLTDDDGDGAVDCADDDCAGDPGCGCTDACTPEGETRCAAAGEVVETCAVGADECLAWVGGTDCAATGGICDDSGLEGASCVTPCTHACAPEGGTECDGDVINTCQVGGDGCRGWVAGTDCAATGGNCDDSGPEATCVSVAGCVAAGGICESSGEFPQCGSNREPLDPLDMQRDCMDIQACCVAAEGTPCADAGFGCYPPSDLGGCDRYWRFAHRSDLACNDPDLVCCAPAAP